MRLVLAVPFLLLTVVVTAALPAQQSNVELLDAYYQRYLPEKVFVHTDKNVYAAGETIRAAVYLLNGLTHQPDSLSKTIYLELHDSQGQRVARRALYAADGHSAGSILLPVDLPAGTYQLSAYTNYQRNSYLPALFRKPVRVLGGLKEAGGVGNDSLGKRMTAEPAAVPTDTNRLRFFPEGGDCAVGLPCRIAVVYENAAGSSLPCRGQLMVGGQPTDVTVTTGERGVGRFVYTPGVEGAAGAYLRSGAERYAWPPAIPEAVHLTVHLARDTVILDVAKSDRTGGLAGHTLIVHLRGYGLYEQAFTTDDERFRARLPLELIPPGVVVASVLDPRGQAVAERLFFVPPRESTVAIGAGQPRYGTRTEAAVRLAIPRNRTLPDSLNHARLSLSILPPSSLGGPASDDVRTWVLLNSDLDRPLRPPSGGGASTTTCSPGPGGAFAGQPCPTPRLPPRSTYWNAVCTCAAGW